MFERNQARTLSPYSRMALVVRGWGLEVVLAFAVVALWHAAVSLDGAGLAVLAFGSLGLALWRFERLRRRFLATLRDRSTRRWLARVLVACEVISRHGLIPRVEGSEVIPAGQRLDLRLPPGLTAEQLDEAAETLAAAMGAREVRVRARAFERRAVPPLDPVA